MTRCPDNSEWVLWGADEVTPDRHRELDAHRATCDACRRESASVARGMTALARMDRTVEPRAEAMVSLRRRMAEVRAEKAARPRVLTFLYSHRWSAAAAAVFVMAFVAWTAVAPPTHPTDTVAVKVRTDAQVQEDLARIAASLEMLESADSAVAMELTPAHPAPAQPLDTEDPYMDEFEQLMDALEAETDT